MSIFNDIIKDDQKCAQFQSDMVRATMREYANRLENAFYIIKELEKLVNSPKVEHVKGVTSMLTMPVEGYGNVKVVFNNDGEPIYAEIEKND